MTKEDEIVSCKTWLGNMSQSLSRVGWFSSFFNAHHDIIGAQMVWTWDDRAEETELTGGAGVHRKAQFFDGVAVKERLRWYVDRVYIIAS